MKGRVPDQVSVSDAEIALQLSCVRQLARIKRVIGDLDQIKRIVFLRGKVQVVSGFGDLTRVVDACSSLRSPRSEMPESIRGHPRAMRRSLQHGLGSGDHGRAQGSRQLASSFTLVRRHPPGRFRC